MAENTVISLDSPGQAIREIVERCEGMQYGEKRTFELDREPHRDFKSILTVRLAQAYQGNFSYFRPGGTTIEIHCYDPND